MISRGVLQVVLGVIAIPFLLIAGLSFVAGAGIVTLAEWLDRPGRRDTLAATEETCDD
jgi:hypothetical protein